MYTVQSHGGNPIEAPTPGLPTEGQGGAPTGRLYFGEAISSRFSSSLPSVGSEKEGSQASRGGTVMEQEPPGGVPGAARFGS